MYADDYNWSSSSLSAEYLLLEFSHSAHLQSPVQDSPLVIQVHREVREHPDFLQLHFVNASTALGAGGDRHIVADSVPVDDGKQNFWISINKANLKLFSKSTKKKTVKVNDKIIKLRKSRDLMQRFLVVFLARPDLGYTLEEAIEKYEFSVIPRSLFESDGTASGWLC